MTRQCQVPWKDFWTVFNKLIGEQQWLVCILESTSINGLSCRCWILALKLFNICHSVLSFNLSKWQHVNPGTPERALKQTQGPWFFDEHEHPTMIDFIFVSHVERMLASCAFWKVSQALRLSCFCLSSYIETMPSFPYPVFLGTRVWTYVIQNGIWTD